MKYLSFLIIVLLTFTFSCGVKQTTANTTKKIAKIETPKPPKEIVEEVIEVPIPKPPKPPKEIENNDFEVFNHNRWNRLLKKYVSKGGNVNYKGFITDSENFEAYLKFLSVNEPQDSWAKVEKFTYWINAYNAFTVKLIIDNYPIKSIKDIEKPWDKKFISIGNNLLSLNYIEHEILRKMDEPRIHFAIVCASVSCPKLQNTAFEASRLEEQLTNVTTAFLADRTRNKISENSFEISKIFKWFAKDFKQNGSLIDFLNSYSEITISQKASKRFMDYDWNLNE